MKKTLFLATYFNNPHFIAFQKLSFHKFIDGIFDFAVLDDSASDTISLISQRKSEEEIPEQCKLNGVQHIKVPQSIHAPISEGGLVPEYNFFAGIHHPTVRHQAVLRWLFDNYKSLSFNQYETVVLMDADMFFYKKINIKQYMENFDMLGSWRDMFFTQELINRNPTPEIQGLLNTRIVHYTLCLLFINMETINNLETFDNGSFAKITDTGGRTKYYIINNPQYNFGFINCGHIKEYQVDLFDKGDPIKDPPILHYRGGSNWSYETQDFYIQKLNRIWEKYIPEFYQSHLEIKHNVISQNKEHIILPK